MVLGDANQYEAIERDIPRLMLSATKQCDLMKMHTEPWSPAIGLATDTIRYWDFRIKHEVGRNPTSDIRCAELLLVFIRR
jgi:hypothetical protein